MRPINLIPPEERRSHGAVSRTGPLAYVVVGVLAVLLVGVVMLVSANNDISDREAEVTSLEAARAAAVAEAEELAPYASFQQVADERTTTIASLADSRFDWPRVIRQLSLILPPEVYLSSLTGSAGGGSEGASEVSGPSLTLVGCAPGQNVVAAFVAALKEIDGVTRVGLNESTLSASSGGGETASGGYCAIGDKAQFEVVAAFDAAPPSPNGDASSFETPAEEEASESAEEGEPAAEESESASGEPAAATTTEPVG